MESELSVLVVDDEKSIRFTLGEFLKQAKYKVYTAEDAKKGLEIVEQNEIDFIVSDIYLPNMSGTHFLHEIKQHYPHIEVILITGEPKADTAIEAVRGRAFDYISKPVTKDVFLRVVRNCSQLVKLRKVKEELEKQNAEYREHLEELVKQRTAELSKLSQTVLEVQEAERANLAQLVHDDLGQALLALKMSLQFFGRTESPERTAELDTHIGNLSKVIERCRNISHHFSPVALARLGLVNAIDDLAAEVGATPALKIELDIEDMRGFFPDDWEVNLYRIIQESLANIIKHAGANQVSIAAKQAEGFLKVTISDNGKGFDAGTKNGGIGMILMQERAGMIGAKLSFESSKEGTTIHVSIPAK